MLPALLVLAIPADPPDACAAQSEFFPHLGFETPALQTFQEDEIALTFDDGPDPQDVTGGVLDCLQRQRVQAAFFVNTHAWGDAPLSAVQQATLQRIHAEGHALGNHTATHPGLELLDDDRVLAELTTVEDTVHALVPQAPPLTLARAPFGRPMYPHSNAQDRARVGSLIGTRAVHIGWHIDPWDWDHTADEPDAAVRVAADVTEALRAGQRGIILLHSSMPWTRDALPEIIAVARTLGLRFVSVETLLQRKYGAASGTLVQCQRRALDLP